MINYRLVVTVLFAGFALLEALFGRLLQREETKTKDVLIEVASGVAIPTVIVPTTLYLAPLLVERVAPGSAGAWAHWPWWGMFGVLLIADDLTQYGWHRLSHEVPWLYNFHRAHHSGRYMSVRVVYRNSLLYYAAMPGLWLSAMLMHLGFGPVYVVYIIAKMAVIIGAHSSVPWDAPLLRNRWTRPVMWLVARIISTPATHAAHHGRHLADGVTHYKGNFGNFLFLWDVLFGTAKITNRRPTEFGLENVASASWFQELIWPTRSEASAELAQPSPVEGQRQ